MLTENYRKTSQALAALNNLGDVSKSNLNGRIAKKLLDALCNNDSSVAQIYSAALGALAPSTPMIRVQGGILPKNSKLAGQKVADFEIGKYPVTVEEWEGCRNWALENGFFMATGNAYGPQHPIIEVSWFDSVIWCNAKSRMEGLQPVYEVEGAIYDGCFLKAGQSLPTVNGRANGYRLPLENEWEWAARGGGRSKGFTYAGSNDLNAVGWYKENSGGAAHAVGEKAANELGLFDMSGNVWEWCWDVYDPQSSDRRIRGGGWDYDADFCTLAFGVSSGPDDRDDSIGFRLARSLGN